MSDQKKKSGNSQNPVSTKTLVISAGVLLAALVIGLTIREIRTRSVEPQVANVTPDVNETPKEPEIPIIVRSRRPVEDVAVTPPAPQTQPEPVIEEPVRNEQANAMNNRQMMWQNSPQMQDAVQLMSWFGNLSQEERTQLMQGLMTSFLGIMQRWQTMPSEQVQAEREQFQQMIQNFRNLPPDQRQQGIQVIQQQLEQWLQAGQ